MGPALHWNGMLNLGLGEIFIVIVLALVFVGPERLPHMVRYLGRQYGKLLRASEELRRAFVLEADRMDAERRTEDLRRRRDEARRKAEEARQAREAGAPPPPDAPSLPEDAARRGPAPPAPAAGAPAEPPDAGDAAARALAERGLPVDEAPHARTPPPSDVDPPAAPAADPASEGSTP